MFVFSHTDFEYYTLLVGHFCGCFKETGPSSFNLPPKLFVWAFFYAPCTVFVILLRSPHSFTSTYTQLDDGALPTVPFTWRTLQLAPLTSEEPTSPSLSLREARNHPVLISRKLYSPAFVCFTSRLVFYSGSNVLNKAAWSGLFPWHGLSAR